MGKSQQSIFDHRQLLENKVLCNLIGNSHEGMKFDFKFLLKTDNKDL